VAAAEGSETVVNNRGGTESEHDASA